MLKLSLKIDSIYLLRPVSVDIGIPYPNLKNKNVNAFVWAFHCAMKGSSFYFENLNLSNYVDEKNICLIVPDLGNSFFVDNATESVGSFIKNELFPITNELLSYCGNESSKTIGVGISMGAYGLINWSLSCQNIFDSVNLISGVYDIKKEIDPRVKNDRNLKNLAHVVSRLDNILLDGNGNYLEHCDLKKILEKKSSNTKTRYTFFCGAEDFLSLEQSRDFCSLLKDNGVDSEITISDGSHDEKYWNNIIKIIFDKLT